MCALISIALVIFGLWKGDSAVLITSGLFAMAASIGVKNKGA